MNHQRPNGTALRTLTVVFLAAGGVVLGAGCGSGEGEGGITVPSGVSLAPGDLTLPDDVTITRPADEVEPEPTAAPEPEQTTEPQPEPTTGDVIDDVTGDENVDETAPPSDGADDDAVVWWPWVLGLVLVVALVAALATRGRRATSGWTARASTVLDELDGLTTHLLVIPPEGLPLVARGDAQRLAELGALTADLSATAPDDRTRRSIDQVRGPLGQLHAAVDLVALSPTPTDADLALVRQWATALHSATSTANATLTPQPS